MGQLDVPITVVMEDGTEHRIERVMAADVYALEESKGRGIADLLVKRFTGDLAFVVHAQLVRKGKLDKSLDFDTFMAGAEKVWFGRGPRDAGDPDDDEDQEVDPPPAADPSENSTRSEAPPDSSSRSPAAAA